MSTDRLTIRFPAPLRQYAAGTASIEVAGHTVADALASLTAAHRELRRRFHTEDGKLRALLNVYPNDDNIRYLDKENTPGQLGDVISIAPSIARSSGACRGMCCYASAHVRRRGNS
jgi:molybdopterin converting factor small subunit